MSLRDFNTPVSDDPLALHNEPSGNGVGLESFHTTQPEDVEPNNMPKIVGAVAVALMVGVAGVALYASSGHQPKPMVAASNLPAIQSAPASSAPDANMPAPAADNTPAPAPAASVTPVDKAPAPVKSASISKKHSASPESSTASNAPAGSAAADRMAADSSQSTTQPQQQQAVAEPVSPQPSPSDVATNNTQSGAAVPQGATTASDIPAQPATPAPDQSTPQQAGQQPSAAQSAGQVAQ